MSAALPRRLILASSSSRRHELLGRLGVPFDTLDPDVDEPPPGPGAAGVTYARQMAELKAAAALARLPRGGDAAVVDVLASDTVVEVAGEIMGKPIDRADAIRILTALSGSLHEVITGWCLVTAVSRGDDAVSGADVTRVRFRALSQAEIEAYVDSGEAFGKAGAYAIQEHGDRFVADIDGEFTTVVGLPLPVVADLLEARGYPVRRPIPPC